MNWILIALATLQPMGTYSSRVGCELEIKQIIRSMNPAPRFFTVPQEDAYKIAIDGLYNRQKDYICVQDKPEKKVDK